MPIDANIINGLKPVQFDGAGIVNMLQRGQALRMQQEAHAQQMQLGAQHIEEGKAAVQKSQIEARDQQIKQQAFLNSKGDPKATVQAAISMGASPDAVMSLQKHDADLQEKYAKTDSDKLPVRKYQNEQMLGLHDQAINLATTDPQAYANGGWQKLYDAALQIDPSNADHLDRNTPMSVEQLRLSQVAHATDAYYLTQAEEKRKQAGEVRAQSVEQRASLMAPAQLEKAKADALAADLGNAGRTISKVTDQASYNDWAAQQPKEVQAVIPAKFDNKTAATIQRLGMTPDQAVTTGQTASHNAATEANEKAMRANAAGHLKIQQDTYNQTYGKDANPALVGVEPHLRVPAAAGAQKIADEYGKAMDASANMQTFIDAARSGNKMAGSNLPIMGAEALQALNGIKRINRTEIDAYQGAGSLLDKIQGKIGKLVSGQPIPADVMKDIEDLQSKLASNATSSANAKMDAHNGIYRSNFKLTPRANAPAGAGRKPLSEIFK